MNNRPPAPKFRRLVDRLYDGPALSKQEVAQLEEFLENDEALAYYVAVSQQEALVPIAIPELDESTADGARERIAPFFRHFSQIAIPLAAACVVFALGLGLGRRMEWQSGDIADQEPVRNVPSAVSARITGLVGVEWVDESVPHQIDLDASSSQIAIESGLVELTYSSGVCVTLEGPARYSVEGGEAGRLEAGKLYTTVPKGAEGFRVHYSGGILEDLGTEFAMDALPDGRMEVGVFSGKVQLHSEGRDAIMLFENQSLVQTPDAANPFEPIPLNREKFVDRLPARDFRWEVDAAGTREFTIDVTHLVWKPAKYRAIFKWISGHDAVNIRDVRLFRDGIEVASDSHPGSTGVLRHVSNNIYALDVKQGQYERGRWTIKVRMETMERGGGALAHPEVPIGSSGILQFEEGLVTGAEAEQFIGRWSYTHLGSTFVREFKPNGSVTLEQNGKNVEEEIWAKSRWWVDRGVLNVSIPHKALIERHVLRDEKTLIFTSNPYENAVKLPSE